MNTLLKQIKSVIWNIRRRREVIMLSAVLLQILVIVLTFTYLLFFSEQPFGNLEIAYLAFIILSILVIVGLYFIATFNRVFYAPVDFSEYSKIEIRKLGEIQFDEDVLSLKMNMRWKAHDMKNLSEALDEIYNLLYRIENYNQPLIDFYDFDDIYNIPEEHELRIYRLFYASPGSGDWLGLGKIIENLRKLVIDVLSIPHNFRMQKINVRTAEAKSSQEEQEAISRIIKNVDSMIELNKKLQRNGYNQKQIDKIQDQIIPSLKNLKTLSDEGKLLPPADKDADGPNIN